jgi:hypothetical protein
MHYYNATTCFGLIRPSSDDTYVRKPMHRTVVYNSENSDLMIMYLKVNKLLQLW